MNIFKVIFQSVVALLGIGVLGFWVIRREVIPENILHFLSVLAIDIALPSIVFSNVVSNLSPSDFPDWWQLPLWWLVFSSVALLLTLITMFVSQKNTRSEFALSLFFQNGIFFPLIIISGLFGRETPYLLHLFIFMMFHPTLYFGTYHLFFRNRTDKIGSKLNLKRILNPVLIATLIAVAVGLLGIKDHLPEFIISIFQILGEMALPLVMIILGGSLYLDFQKKGKIYVAEIVKFVLIKNIVFPLVFLGLLIILHPDYNVALLFILQSAVPPITGIPIVTEREGGNRAITNQFILASFIFSIISIPVIFNLFNTFFPMP